MTERRSGLDFEDVAELDRTHAHHEGRGEFEPRMETVVSDAVDPSHPLGVRIDAADRVRCYYERVQRHCGPLVQRSQLLELVASTRAVVIEYEIQLCLEGDTLEERRVAVLPVQGRLFAGERIYSSEGMLRLLLGEVIDETRPMASPIS